MGCNRAVVYVAILSGDGQDNNVFYEGLMHLGITMTAHPGQILTQTTLGQLCAALWDSQSHPGVIQPAIEPGSVVTPQALRCSTLDRCATQELMCWVFRMSNC
jgi:hypothetical protein